MRYIKDIPDKDVKIGLYQWNNKYIVKLESGLYEQTFKIDDYEVENVEELEKCIDKDFVESVKKRFNEMHGSFFESLKRNNVIY